MTSVFFRSNRKQLGELIHNGVAILSSYNSIQRSNDSAFGFEQEANFWYLTGIDVSDWWVIIDTAAQKSWLVAPDVDAVHQVFDGSLAWDDAKRISGIDTVLFRVEAKQLLLNLAKTHDTVYTLGPDPHEKHYNFVVNPAQASMRRMLKNAFVNVADCRQDLAKLRAIKQLHEIAAMEKAIALTTQAFADVKKKLPQLKAEYQVEAEFTYAFRKSGAMGHAYDPIVASGANARTLHYSANQAALPPNGLLLIDIGARVDGYAADITRTYAVGTPTQRQKDVHAAVERAHHAIIALLKPGLNVRDYHASVQDIMKQELVGLGLMSSPDDEASCRKYFPHAISHGLGIDVHDSLGKPDTFAPGMVLTVEPGIYISSEGIGVRIEDDILITDTGHRNLSAALPTSL